MINIVISDIRTLFINNIPVNLPDEWKRRQNYFIFSSISGTALNKSATNPQSETWKIGASGSLFMATIVFESFIPAKCWIAPEIPTAMYNS